MTYLNASLLFNNVYPSREDLHVTAVNAIVDATKDLELRDIRRRAREDLDYRHLLVKVVRLLLDLSIVC